MKILKGTFVILILCMLSLPLFQKEFSLVNQKKLNGYFRLQPEPELEFFTCDRLFSGEFQENISNQIEDHVGLRNTFFRIHNEYDYRLFGVTHAKGFIQGEEGYLFEEDYIREYTGEFFIGKETIDYKLKKLKDVQQQFQEEGIEFLLIFEPGKASFHPEYIPEIYHPEKRSISNYDYITKRTKELDIPMMNLNEYFLLMKDTSRFPLFPKYGMHWSIYGASLVLDTLKQHIEWVCQTPLPEIRIAGIRVSDSLIWTDKDIGDMLNLIFPLPEVTMAYPKIEFDTTNFTRNLSVLVVADSYYINLINDYTGNLFKDEEYWYYNSKLYPDIIDNQEPVYVDKDNLKEKFREFDIILLMVSEINLHCGFWNFPDEAYQAYFPEHTDPVWYPYENRIRNEPEWFRFMVKKAKENHTTLENIIRKDAKYLYHTENP